MSKKSEFFRANAGVLVIDAQGCVLAFQRTGSEQWQLPQGGIDRGEDPLVAAQRELFEETGITIDRVEWIATHSEWLPYVLPKGLRSPKKGLGQIQKWFLFWLRDDPLHIDLAKAPDQEFQAYKWTTIEALIDEVIYFRKPIYRKLATEWADYLL